jgi:hypothetical protein
MKTTLNMHFHIRLNSFSHDTQLVTYKQQMSGNLISQDARDEL